MRQSRACLHPKRIRRFLNETSKNLAEGIKTSKKWHHYCDIEFAETNQKKSDKTAEIEKLSAKVASSSVNSAKLKEEVATLQAELAELNSAEMEKGLNGIKMALKVLNDYYVHKGRQSPQLRWY